MYASRNAAVYANTSIQTDVLEASPHKLILMLFDGALLSLARAKIAIENNILDEKIKNISKAIDIISLGLKASLDTSSGGDLAIRLSALYDYMCARITFSNATNTTAPVDEVIALLKDLREAWSGIEESASMNYEGA